jgi:hypothetical protein
MRTYPSPLLLIIGCLLMMTVSSCRSFGFKKDYQNLTGSWKEEWGADDVTYNDIYQIAYLGGNKLAITCKGRPNYVISSIAYDKKILRLQLEIRDNKYKTGSATVQYELKLIQSPSVLSGTAINHENKTISVKWVKQE